MSAKEVEDAVKALLRERGEFQCGELSERTGRSRQALHRHLSKWVTEGRLVREGQGRGTRYRSARYLAFERNYPLQELVAEEIWREVQACLAESPMKRSRAADAVLEFALLELVNNAIAFSGARSVTVELIGEGERLILSVADGGIGALESLLRGLKLEDHLHALQELTKGKTTTRPRGHAGKGIFFVSKMVERFELTANGFEWSVDNERGDQAVRPGEHAGTKVRVQLSPTTAIDPTEVMALYEKGGEIDSTRAVVRLFEGSAEFASRAEAQRLVSGLDRFREVVLDFRGVEGVGAGFVDEVFRIWTGAHPNVRLIPREMNEAVAFMIQRGLPRRNGGGVAGGLVGH